MNMKMSTGQSESIKELSAAIVAVMKEVDSVGKSLTVGTGKSAYAAVADKDVKIAIGGAMANNGLSLIPTGFDPKVTINRWEETGQYGTSMKQSVFTEGVFTYKLLHISGEWMEVAGYGQGVDSQDKSAGKASTYAGKNLLLNMFLVPTGAIDDTDTTHSSDMAVPKVDVELPWVSDAIVKATVTMIENKNKGVVMDDKRTPQELVDSLKTKFKVSKENNTKLEAAIKSK